MSGLRILIVNGSLPQYDRSSGALRLFRLVGLLADAGHAVTFLARRGIGQERYTVALVARGVDVRPLDVERLRERSGEVAPGEPLDFADLCREGQFDVALLSFYEVAEQYLPLVRRHSPLTRIIVDTVDVHHVRERREAELAGDRARLAAAERTRQREASVYGAADGLVAVSEDDAAALRALAPGIPISVVGNIHDDQPPGSDYAERAGLVFVGNFAHKPNIDAICDFHARAWPLVRRALLGVRLTVVGTDPPPEVLVLGSDAVEVTGWVPDVVPYLDRARISIAPLRYGAGVKGKIGEAMSHGLPVVTTTIGAEGMSLRDEEHTLVADTPEAFAAAVVRLHEDPVLWTRLAGAGRRHIATALSPSAARDALHALLEQTARTVFVADADRAPAALPGYLAAFSPDDRVTLVLTVPEREPERLEAAFATASRTIEALGRDPEAIPDVEVTAWAKDLPLPGRAVAVGGAELALGVDAPAARWREAAAGRPVAPRRPAPHAALLVHAPDDSPALAAQLDALARAGVPDDVELVIVADAPGAETETVLRGASGARIVRGTSALGRRAAWQLAAEVTRAPRVVALSPLALPAAGFLDPLLRAAEGVALAGPIVDGACGYRAETDGSLWPRSSGDEPATLDALALDCLVGARELFAEGLPEWHSGDGHRELQLARWANARGGIALADARVGRLGAPAASVIICTRNRAEELPDAVTLLRLAGARDIVIVDNASTDETADVAAELEARGAGVVRVVSEPQAGLCHARNAGAQAARHDLLLYVDDDARVAPGWLEHVARTLARPGVANVGGPICALWPAERPDGWPGRRLEALLSVLDYGDAEQALRPPKVVYGANWAVRRSALDAVGGFDPAFGPAPGSPINGDETSVAWRLDRARAGTTRFTPDGAIGHRISPDRIDDRFLLHRSLCVGVERPRHAHALGEAPPARLFADARDAAARLLRTVSLAGELSVGEALERIAGAPLDRAGLVHAADALGQLAACVHLAGEREVHAGELHLTIHDDVLRGLVEPLAAAT